MKKCLAKRAEKARLKAAEGATDMSAESPGVGSIASRLSRVRVKTGCGPGAQYNPYVGDEMMTTDELVAEAEREMLGGAKSRGGTSALPYY